MDRGLLVPDDLVIRMVLERLSQPDAQRGFILDGFPRTLEQARALDSALGECTLERVLLLRVSDEEIVRRLSARLTCRVCGAVYNLLTQPPRTPGRCDRCGGELYQREDDRPEVVRQRLRTYWEQTAPLADHYRRQGKLVEVDGEGPPEVVARRLREALGPPPH